MGLIHHFTLALISLSCLFSFSSSTNAPSPVSEDVISRELLDNIISNAPLPSDGVQLEKMDVDPGLQQICGNTEHPVECILASIPFLDEKSPIGSLSVIKAGIQAMDNQAKDAVAKATRLAQDPTTPTNIAPILRTCIGVYNDILESDRKALEAISKHNLVGLSIELSNNVEHVHGCDEAFKKAKVKSPMKKVDEMLAKTMANTLSIGVDLVKV